MRSTKKDKLYIVDDSKEFRQAIKLYAETELNAEIIGEANDGKEAINDGLIHHADIVLMDISMKQMNGLEATTYLTNRSQSLRVLAVTNSREELTMHSLIGCGFKGCVRKNLAFSELPQAIHKVKKGGYFFSKNILIDK